MKKVLIIVSCILIGYISYGQNNSNEYRELIKKAETLFRTRNYKNAALAYSAAFDTDNAFFADRYNAACAWALSNYPDSAIAQLERISNMNGFTYSDVHELITDEDLTSITLGHRFKEIKAKLFLKAYKTFLKERSEAGIPYNQDSTNIDYALALGDMLDSVVLHINDVAYIFLKKKDFDKAYKLFKLSIDHFPSSHILYHNLTDYHLETGNKDKATANFARSIELKYAVPAFSFNKYFKIDSAVTADYSAFSQKVGYKVQPPSFLISNVTTTRLNKEVSRQINDTTFNTKIFVPAHPKIHPVIGFDEGHYNAFKVTGKMNKLGELLENDGYKIVIDTGRVTPSKLLNYNILIIGGAIGRLKRDSFPQAFSLEEIEEVYNWVLQGGSLLLMTDHPPFDTSVTALVSRLGSKQGVGIVRDSVNSFKSAKRPDYYQGWIIFSKENNGLSNHPILFGRNQKERIHKVMTQGGSSISGPAGNSNILQFSKFAQNEMHRTFVGPTQLQKAQMIAYGLGKGRVVITADGTFFSAQTVILEDGESFGLGMSRADFDNRQLVLNIMHWLSYAIK